MVKAYTEVFGDPVSACIIVIFTLCGLFIIFGTGTLHDRLSKKMNFLQPSTAIEAAGVEFQALSVDDSNLTSSLPSDRRLPTQGEYEAFMEKFGFTRFQPIRRIDNRVVARNNEGWLLTVNSGSKSIYPHTR